MKNLIYCGRVGLVNNLCYPEPSTRICTVVMMTVNRFLIWYHCVFLAVSQCSMILNDEVLSISADRIGINTNILLYPHHQTIASSSASFPSETRICDVIKVQQKMH